MHYYPHHIGDFNSATRHLTRLERSLYRDMIEMYYETECQLPSDLKMLCRKIVADFNECSTTVQQLLNEFFIETPEGWYHKRCEEEIERYKSSMSQKAAAGKASAAKRALKAQQALNGRSTGVEIPFNGNPTNQEPLTKNHEPLVSNTDVLLVSSESENQKRKPDCPHQQIIDLYHEVLPQCPRIRDWTPARQQQLRARWNEDEKRQNLEYWKKLFEYISTCDFLVGKSGQKPFFADLEWITKSANFTKIREQKYENRK